MKSTFRFLLVALSVFTSTNPLHAQWVQTSGPYFGSINCFAISGTNLFVGTGDRYRGTGVYLSTNNGTNWTAVNNGLEQTYVYDIAVSGTNLFAVGTYNDSFQKDYVFLSTNNGSSWTKVNSGLPTDVSIYCIAVNGTYLFLGALDGVYISIDNGTRWSKAVNGMPSDANGGRYVYDLVVSGTNLLAGTGYGVYPSTNNGISWTAINNGLKNYRVTALAVSGTNLFVATIGDMGTSRVIPN